MEKISLPILNLKAIRLLILLEIINILIIIVTVVIIDNFIPVVCIFGLLLFVCLIVHIYLQINKIGYIVFSSESVNIISKKINCEIEWGNIKGIYYNSIKEFFPGLEHFTIDIVFKYNGNIHTINSMIGQIKSYKKTYKKIIQFIPLDIIEENEFMIYRNIIEKKKKSL